MSVWTDAETLFGFVYRTAHVGVMTGRREWFERLDSAHQALWWVSGGLRPTIDEALARLWLLDNFGASEHAFTFKTRFPAPGQQGAPIDMEPDPWCIGRA